MVVSIAVGTGDGVITDGEAFLSVFLVDIRFFALLAGDMVVSFFVSSSTTAALDRAVGVNFVAELPASGALDEVDFLNPLSAEVGCVEEEDGFANPINPRGAGNARSRSDRKSSIVGSIIDHFWSRLAGSNAHNVLQGIVFFCILFLKFLSPHFLNHPIKL